METCILLVHDRFEEHFFFVFNTDMVFIFTLYDDQLFWPDFCVGIPSFSENIECQKRYVTLLTRFRLPVLNHIN